MQCPQCAATFTDPAGKCPACGHLPASNEAAGQALRIEPGFVEVPDASAPSAVMQELYKAAVGEKHQDYYLRQFARFDQAGRTSATWHWPASLSTLNWLAWRGMWNVALMFAAICLGLELLVFGIGRLVFDFSSTTELMLLAAGLAVVFVLPGLFANAAYYRFSKKRIEAALVACATIDEACTALTSSASSNRRWFVLAATNTSLVAGIGLFAWLLTSSAGFDAAAPSPPSQPVVAIAIEPPAASPIPSLKVSDPATPLPIAWTSAPEPVASTAASAPTKTEVTVAEFRFALQVGAFANEANARKAQAKLQAAGFKAYLEELETSQGKRIRVRVGPFATRDEAEKAAPLINELDLPALLVKV
ncbi:MAG: SPOR domain-containing protein [Rhodoferax sp.]|nr:SPOR domain-containing protein [Rhodoferax sp.]